MHSQLARFPRPLDHAVLWNVSAFVEREQADAASDTEIRWRTRGSWEGFAVVEVWIPIGEKAVCNPV